jgi:hypothetical protein
MTNLLPYAIAWAVLAVIVLGLAISRRSIASNEDDSIHLTDGGAAVGQQVAMAKKLEGIDKWGKILTIVLVISGLALAAVYAMQLWDATSKVGLA